MKAGFARIEITPSLGCSIAGDYNKHFAEGFLTGLYANAVAFSDGENTVCAVSMDLLEMPLKNMNRFRKYIAEHTGLPFEALFLSCTHTHLGPDVGGYLFDIDEIYFASLCAKVSDAVTLAVRDMKDAKAYIAKTQAEDLSAIRRFRMTDGTVKMNPAPGPEVVEPVGTPDHTVQLVRLVREGASDIAVINFQTHPDVVSGNPDLYNHICHDWPGFTRKYLEAALADVAGGNGVISVVFNGAQGDTNHLTESFKKRMPDSFEHSKHMGRKLAGAVMSVYTYAEEVSSDKVFFGYKSIFATPKKAKTEEKLAESKKIYDIFRECEGLRKGRQFIGSNSLARTAEAVKYVRLADAPDKYELTISSIGFGDVAFVGIPGEPFTEIGRTIKEKSPFAMTIPCCNTNGSEGYFSMRADIEGGVGYEAMSARFEVGVSEDIIDCAIALTKEIKDSFNS